MSTNFKTLLSLTAVAAFFISATAFGDYRDYNYKGWNSIWLREHQATRSNRAVTPMVARSQPAPVEVAQAPTNERAYSYEPSQQQAAASTPCDGSAAASADTAQKTTTNRSFSYEPGATYSAPAVYRGSYSRGSFGGGNSYENAMRAKGY
jgi:hypothetical protein